jgi:hypothetical protein
MQSETSLPAIDSNARDKVIWPARVALVLLVGWMCVSGYLRHPSRYELEISRWINGDVSRVEQIARRLIFEWCTDLAAFVAVGALVYLAMGTLVAGLRSLARIGVLVVVGIAICGLVRAVQLSHLPAPGHLVLPLLAYLSGMGIGRAGLRGPRALVWSLPPMAAVLILAGGIAVGVGWRSLDDKPLPFEPTAVTMGDKRGLANTLRGSRTGANWARRVRLNEQDLTLLIATGLARVSPASKARVKIDGALVEAELSYPFRLRGKEKFVNLRLLGSTRIDGGELTIYVDRMAIGKLTVPSILLRLVSPSIATAIRHDRDLRSMVGSIDSLRLEGGSVETVFKPGECSNTFVPALAQAITGKPNVSRPVRAHVWHLVEGAEDLPLGDGRFTELLRRALAFARLRSIDGDPLIENQSALLALAILLGDPRVETVVGPVLDDRLRELAGSRLNDVTLRGRRDWTKHFYVSATIALLACEGTSDKIGVLKEVLDAEEGGSGFSFGDLIANRAGILLARAATYNLDSARALQARLSVEFPIGAVFPEADDLPENLTAAELQSRYGGVDGVEYRRLVAEIERRLSECVALR